MSTILTLKYKTVKVTEPSSTLRKRPTAVDVFSQQQQHQHHRSASLPALDGKPASTPYPLFLAGLISAFNSLTSSTAAPTSSPTLHTFFQGADHEALVDNREKKKVIKALQNADPAKVNEVIALLKAMPDPTTMAPTTTTATAPTPGNKNATTKQENNQNNNTNNSKKKKKTQESLDLDKELEEWDKIDKKWAWEVQKSNDQTTGVVDPQSCIGITSPAWWFSTSTPSSPIPAATTATATATATATITSKDDKKSSTNSTGYGSLRFITKSSKPTPPLPIKKGLSTGEQIALAAAALLAIAAVSKPKELQADANAKASSGLHRQSSMPNLKTSPLKALLHTSKSTPDGCKVTNTSKNTSSTTTTVAAAAATASSPISLVATINSFSRQLLALQLGSPPTSTVSAFTYWWGFEIYVPHKCMITIQHVSNTSQIFFNILTSAIAGIPALSVLVPIANIIASWVEYQWTAIKSEDLGKGVVISAIWILPVALASRPWDHPCCGDDPSSLHRDPLQPKKSLKSKLRLIGK